MNHWWLWFVLSQIKHHKFPENSKSHKTDRRALGWMKCPQICTTEKGHIPRGQYDHNGWTRWTRYVRVWQQSTHTGSPCGYLKAPCQSSAEFRQSPYDFWPRPSGDKYGGSSRYWLHPAISMNMCSQKGEGSGIHDHPLWETAWKNSSTNQSHQYNQPMYVTISWSY